MSEIVLEQNRITGTEMEYPSLVRYPDQATRMQQNLEASDLLNRFFGVGMASVRCPPGGRQYRNGARAYPDQGYPEYATPEDDSFIGTLANDFAGALLMDQAFARAVEAADRNSDMQSYELFKNVLDDEGHSWGFHTNYTIDAQRMSITEKDLTLLGIHLATASLLTGAGALRRRPDGTGEFTLAQKAMTLQSDFSPGTTMNKPLVNLRDETHADGNRFRRVHVVSGDPHLSPWALFMQLGMNSLVLRLQEQGRKLPDYIQFKENTLHQVALQTATDLTLKKTVELAGDGPIKKMTPLEIQFELMAAANELAEQEGATWEEQLVLTEWERALGQLEEKDMTDPVSLDLMSDRVEWAARRQLCLMSIEKLGLDKDDPKAWGEYAPWRLCQFHASELAACPKMA